MTSFKFIHAADLHLDSPLLGLGSRTDAPIERAREATRQAMRNLVDLAIQEEVAFVVIAGDLYDGTWRDMRTGIFVIQQLARLARERIYTFIVLGNHDAESKITADLPKQERVHIFGSAPGEVVTLEELGVAVHGRSFRTQAVTENLASTYGAPVAGMFNVAVLHTALEGDHAHANYAPCTVAELRSSGHHYWALGHVHDHKVHSEHPHIVYPGNTQARSIRETGPKGIVLVEVDAGEVVRADLVPIDDLRWAMIRINPGEGVDLHDAFREELDRVIANAEGRPVIARVAVEGDGDKLFALQQDGDAFEADLRALAAQASGEIWLEKIVLEEMSASSPILPEEFTELLEGATSDADAQAFVEAALKPLADKLPNLGGGAEELTTLLQSRDWAELATRAARTIAERSGSPR